MSILKSITDFAFHNGDALDHYLGLCSGEDCIKRANERFEVVNNV